MKFGALAIVVVAVIATASASGARIDRFTKRVLVTDRADAQLVNGWGLAASSDGPWWVSNEGRSTSTLYSSEGQKQALTVAVPGGPTGVVFNGGPGFLVHANGASAPARFIYACEDGMIRGWAPTVPNGWSRQAVVAVDTGASGIAVPRRHARAREAVRDGLPQRPHPRLRLEVAPCRQGRRVRRSCEVVLVRTVRHPGDRRPDLRHVRVPRTSERQRRLARRLRRRVRPRRPADRARRPEGRARRAVGRRARSSWVRQPRRRSPRRELRQREDQRLPARSETAGRFAAGCP